MVSSCSKKVKRVKIRVIREILFKVKTISLAILKEIAHAIRSISHFKESIKFNHKTSRANLQLTFKFIKSRREHRECKGRERNLRMLLKRAMPKIRNILSKRTS